VLAANVSEIVFSRHKTKTRQDSRRGVVVSNPGGIGKILAGRRGEWRVG
jgi:hypothetical protein